MILSMSASRQYQWQCVGDECYDWVFALLVKLAEWTRTQLADEQFHSLKKRMRENELDVENH